MGLKQGHVVTISETEIKKHTNHNRLKKKKKKQKKSLTSDNNFTQ
jgi:hypothetical protein